MLESIDDQTIASATGGQPFDVGKPTIVFIHGAGMDSTAWHLPARWFAHHGWSVLAPDLPGHGRSSGTPIASLDAMVSLVARLLEHKGVKAAVLVGHSMGGAIALELAARMGPQARGLGLIGTSASIPVGAGLLANAKTNPEAAYRMMITGAFSQAARTGSSPAPGLFMPGLAMAIFRRNGGKALATDLEACNAWTTGPDAAKRVVCPTLAVIAEKDAMTPPRNGHALASAISGATTVVIPRAGHMLMAEAPDALLDALIATFASSGAGPSKAASAA